MILEKIANKKVITVPSNATMLEAAKAMRDYHVGSVIVVEEKSGRKIPLGIVTDRDIVVSTSAFGIPPNSIEVKDVMSGALVSARKNDSLNHVLNLMKEHGVKRIPITDSEGALFGIVTTHELMNVLSDELSEVVRVTERQHQVESERRPKFG
ncbi:MAG: CBS domain-containing protein [Proteobacteria bacterium]|nr:CBS domain-containing protein [Pseudomonadota bacterium]